MFDHFSAYEARKVGTTPELIASITEKLRNGAPNWFRWELGFRFIWDGSQAVLLGFGGFRQANIDDPLRIAFQPCGMLMAFMYKGEWHISDMNRLDWDWSNVSQIERA
jgi:hypothetical protein